MVYFIYFSMVLILVYWVEEPYGIVPNCLIIRNNPGQELENWLKNFSWGPRVGAVQSEPLPRYKFYTDVVEVILTLARKMGGTYQENLLFLREGLQSDQQFEKKLKDVVLGIWIQMAMMMILTWLFIIGALHLVEIPVKWAPMILIFCWQVLGLSLLPFTLSRLRKKYFADIGKIWKILYVLKSLARVPLSRSEVLKIAGVQDLSSVTQKSLRSLVSKLQEACEKTLKQGASYEEDVRYLMEELRFQEKWHFELFEKRLIVIKLILLSLFFLPSYLAFIFMLLGDLMALM